METLALVLALLCIGMIIDVQDTKSGIVILLIVSSMFLGALALGIYVAVAG